MRIGILLGFPQAQAAAQAACQSISDRQALVEKARQEMQLAVRYKSVLGLGSSIQAHCSARHFNQIMPAYQQASNPIQAQADAPLAHAMKWKPLQHIMDQVRPGTTSPCPPPQLLSAWQGALLWHHCALLQLQSLISKHSLSRQCTHSVMCLLQALEVAGAEVLQCLSSNDSVTSTQLQHGLEVLLQLDSQGPDLAGQPGNRLQWLLKTKVIADTLQRAVLHLVAFVQFQLMAQLSCTTPRRHGCLICRFIFCA